MIKFYLLYIFTRRRRSVLLSSTSWASSSGSLAPSLQLVSLAVNSSYNCNCNWDVAVIENYCLKLLLKLKAYYCTIMKLDCQMTHIYPRLEGVAQLIISFLTLVGQIICVLWINRLASLHVYLRRIKMVIVVIVINTVSLKRCNIVLGSRK